MKKYRIKFKETLTVFVDVEAPNIEAAKEEVERRIRENEVNAATDFDDIDRSITFVRRLT